jgi:hypothetical protein
MNENEQINPLDVAIAELEAQREKLKNAIDALKSLKKIGLPTEVLAAMVNAFRAESSNLIPDAPRPLAIPHDAFYGMTIPDAARKYLSWGGNRQTKANAELCDALVAGGFQTKATNFAESVRATLGRERDFVKIQGQWGLRDWYEDRGARRRPQSSSDTEGMGERE